MQGHVVNPPSVCAQTRAAKGLSKLRTSISEVTGEKRGVAPGSFVDLLVNATDKATGMSLTDLERTNQVIGYLDYLPSLRCILNSLPILDPLSYPAVHSCSMHAQEHGSHQVAAHHRVPDLAPRCFTPSVQQ